MTTIACPFCAAENRSNAKFCISCAKQMVNLETGITLEAKKGRKKRIRSASTASPQQSPSTKWMLAVLGVLVLGGAAWHFFGGQPHSTVQPLTPTESQATPQLATPAQAMEAPASAVLPNASSPLPTLTANASSPMPSAPQAPATPSPLPKPVKEKAAPVPTPAREVTAAPSPAPPPPTSVAEHPVRPAAAPNPAPVAPEQSCSGTSFLNKAACMQRQCNNTPDHPQCRSMRETQDALRNGSGG